MQILQRLRKALYERTACQILIQRLRFVYRCNKIQCHCMLHERTAAKWSASYIRHHVVDPRCRSGRRQRSLSNIDSFQRLHGRGVLLEVGTEKKLEMGNGKREMRSCIIHRQAVFLCFFANWCSRLNQQLEWKLNPNPNTNTKVVRAGPKYRFRRSVPAQVANCE